MSIHQQIYSTLNIDNSQSRSIYISERKIEEYIYFSTDLVRGQEEWNMYYVCLNSQMCLRIWRHHNML